MLQERGTRVLVTFPCISFINGPDFWTDFPNRGQPDFGDQNLHYGPDFRDL